MSISNIDFKEPHNHLKMLFFLQKMGRWNSVVDRLYYACFYAVIALLLKNDIETQSHDGSRNQFGLNFVKTCLIDKRYGRLYSKLFDLRQKGDYGDVFEFDKNTVEPLIEETSTFIEVIKKLF